MNIAIINGEKVMNLPGMGIWKVWMKERKGKNQVNTT